MTRTPEPAASTEPTADEELVVVRRHGDGGHVVELVLNRPRAMNAMSTAMVTALGEVTGQLAGDDTARVVVVTSSSPKAFCVGADLKERNTLTDDELRAQRPVARAAYGGVLWLPQPTIAAVDGFALGGGFEIALSCDIVVAGISALVGLPEVSVGVIPGGGGTQLVTRRVGWSRASRVIFTAEKMPASRAHELGLVDDLVDDGAARDHALGLAGTIAANSPVGLRQAKRAMRAGMDTDLRSGLDIEDECWHATAFSADRAEGVAAFAEKRSPRWPGR